MNDRRNISDRQEQLDRLMEKLNEQDKKIEPIKSQGKLETIATGCVNSQMILLCIVPSRLYMESNLSHVRSENDNNAISFDSCDSFSIVFHMKMYESRSLYEVLHLIDFLSFLMIVEHHSWDEVSLSNTSIVIIDVLCYSFVQYDMIYLSYSLELFSRHRLFNPWSPGFLQKYRGA